MPLLSFAIAWVGYSLLTWGVATVRGCNVNFTQVAWPGKFTGCSPDGAAATAPATTYRGPVVPGRTGSTTTNPMGTVPGSNGSGGQSGTVPAGTRPGQTR